MAHVKLHTSNSSISTPLLVTERASRGIIMGASLGFAVYDDAKREGYWDVRLA